MFTSRRSSQKPDEDFYAAFKQSFPDVGPGTTSSGQGPTAGGSLHQRSASFSEAIIDEEPPHRPYDQPDDGPKDQDATPKPYADQWRLTPSLMDPNSYAFSAFANQPPGYYTPTSGGLNNFYHSSAAGDLHTPGMGMNTPLSLPTSLHTLHAHESNLHYTHFNPHMLHHGPQFPDQFSHPPVQQQSQTFMPPSHFLQHEDSGYVGMTDSPHKATPTSNDANSVAPSHVQSMMGHVDLMSASFLPSGEKFRFQTTLNAPTAMVRSSDEIPITYLNKGQAYTMSIFDTAPPNPHPSIRLQYRTYVRVSFEDEQQRAKPGSCWQLWKEGRGSNEAHQRGGKLLAVEYVDPNQGGDEELRKSHIELERASFDGFVVTWYPTRRAPGAPDCSISVRFNFLSTDFSHSKGVKGIPVRLCAKTQLVTDIVDQSGNEPEVCFSKVKLFRDHGAERKLSNDVAHVKKSIEKLKQQITQAESGMNSVGKRKRSGSMAKGEAAKLSAEEDLHIKLLGLQDMFSSTRPVSVLFLKGDSEDDPDLFPVKLSGGEEIKPPARSATWESRNSASESPSSNVSPTPTTGSLTPKRKQSELQRAAIAEEPEDDESSPHDPSVSPGRPVKRVKSEHETTKAEILAIDVDDSYKPPDSERSIKPVACFYVKQNNAPSQYYRAIYLVHRTVENLVQGIAEKFDVDPNRIMQVFHVTPKGLRVVVDEDVVRELPEGQDMMVEFAPFKADHQHHHRDRRHRHQQHSSFRTYRNPIKSEYGAALVGPGANQHDDSATTTAGAETTVDAGYAAEHAADADDDDDGNITAFSILGDTEIGIPDGLEMWLNY